MHLTATPDQAQLIAGAMLAVASADRTEALSPADRAGIASGYRMVFGGEQVLDVDALEPTTPVARAGRT